MDIPTALAALSTGGSAAKALAAWRRKSTGDVRSLVEELAANLRFLDLVAEDDVPISKVIGNLSTSEYDRLSREGFGFNNLKRKKIRRMPSLEHTDLRSWQGKRTEELVFAIYDKVKNLIVKFPYTGNSQKYRWGVRVNNIRKRIWLLLKHINS